MLYRLFAVGIDVSKENYYYPYTKHRKRHGRPEAQKEKHHAEMASRCRHDERGGIVGHGVVQKNIAIQLQLRHAVVTLPSCRGERRSAVAGFGLLPNQSSAVMTAEMRG